MFFVRSRILFFCILVAIASLSGAASANLLLNPGFEDVAGLPLTPGDNITDNVNSPFAVPNWQKTTTSNINLVRVDGPGGNINYGSQGPESDADNSGSGVVKHYLDHVAASRMLIYQTFSFPLCASGTPDPVLVDFGAYFSNRGDTAQSVFAHVRMVAGSSPSAAPMASITSPNIPGGSSRTYAWELRSTTTTLTRGQTYTFTVQMSDQANVDNTFVTINLADRCPSVANDQANVAEYLQARNTMILDHQPDRHRRLDKIRGTAAVQSAALPFAALVSANGASFAASTGKLDAEGAMGAWDIWTEGSVAKFDDAAGRSGRFGVGYLGIDYSFTNAALIGVMLQIDHLDMDFGSADDTIAGTGWMVGPYATVKLGETLFFDVRGAWGESQNSVETAGVTTGKFATQRWLVSGALIGDFHYGNWTIRPEVQAKYISEHQEAFNNDGTMVAAQTIAQGDVRFGPRIAYHHITESGAAFTSYVRADGVYSFADNGAIGVSDGSLASAIDEELRARFEAGLELQTLFGLMVSLSGHYDGVGQDDYEVYGGSLRLAFQLQ